MKISFYLKSRILKNGKNNVMCRVIDGRNQDFHLTTNYKVFKEHFDVKEFRCKETHPEYLQMNKELDNLLVLKRDATDKYDAKKLTLQQLKRHMQGKSDYESIDGYLHSVFKEAKTNTTFTDYRNKISAVKSIMGIKKELMFDEITVDFYDRLYRKMLNKGLAKKTIVGYVKAIDSLLNFAKERGVIRYKSKVPKDIKKGARATRKREIKTSTTEEVEKYIESIESIKQWQSIAIWLLQFCLRGFYPADLVKMGEIEYYEPNYLKQLKNQLYIKHLRSKTRHTERKEMFIHIDQNTTAKLLQMVKRSVVYTDIGSRYEKDIASIHDVLKIYDYEVNKDSDYHKQKWSIHRKRLTRFNLNLMTARKTFNTYGKRLKIDVETRKILLGQRNDPLLDASYDNNEDEVIHNEVQEAHKSVLEGFKVPQLINQLTKKLDALNAPKWIQGNVGIIKDIREKINDWSKTGKNIDRGKIVQKGWFILTSVDFQTLFNDDKNSNEHFLTLANQSLYWKYEEITNEIAKWFNEPIPKSKSEKNKRDSEKYRKKIVSHLLEKYNLKNKDKGAKVIELIAKRA